MIRLGIEMLLQERMDLLKGKKIGLLTNMTGLDSKMNATIDLLFRQPDIQLTVLFGPEHGIRGDGLEGSAVDSSIDPMTRLPVYSLYGKTRKPSQKMLEEIDCIVVDLQDIGVRYYTFISTLSLVMEACMDEGKEVIVLDRPNPINGLSREGNIPDTSFLSFVGLQPIPNRHGLTIGELARVFKYQFGLDCALTVVPMKGWQRSMLFSDTGLLWVQPSPNSTGENMALLYPGMCLIEGTELSEGRGTTRPFEVVGAPYIDGSDLAKKFNDLNLDGTMARPTSFVPYYSKFQGQLCRGVQIHITDSKQFHSYEAGLRLVGLIAAAYPSDFAFRDSKQKRCMFNLLSGDATIQQMVLGNDFGDFFERCESDCMSFGEQVVPYLLY
ncbi:exo-beta-N-acetylmuramidase NamZ domain-containing protein [Sporolactobacillus pectinivorans]|uniref:exo-beta-N-acetylmuramidase NamZ family protein n=1 Tax=Sporolactobacillus pectinivorans TaxID=1591408 RepID=UPI001EFE3659|nr:DUF1343 domain-containing protein [Sporolactobacillus pectinivorans]